MQIRFGFSKAPFLAAAAALLGLIAAGTAKADTYTLCPTSAGQNGSGSFSFGTAAEPSGSACSTAVTMTIPDLTDYARLAWDSSSANYPSGLSLGTLTGASASVALSAGGSDDPYYMLAFTDLTKSLGQTNATDQILMIEFQPSTLTNSGGTLALDPATTLFNMFDNTQGFYLNGGQSHTNTLDGWLSVDGFLAGDALDQVRIGMGLAGGPGAAETVTVNQLDLSTPSVPEPGSLMLTLLLLGTLGLGAGVRQVRSCANRG